MTGHATHSVRAELVEAPQPNDPLRANGKFIYLASQSPRRRQLLEQLGVRHELLLPDADEDAESLEDVLPGEAPASYVQRVTQLKLDAALARLKRRGLPAAPILCSDTTVALGRTIYGKPAGETNAARMLAELAGRTHRVLTAVAIGTARKREQALSTSRVTFAPMSRQQIAAYVASGEPMGKAGAYAVQGRAAAFISHISGSYSGIMGLPMFETAQLLQSFGFKNSCNKIS
jgi:septum formation protein